MLRSLTFALILLAVALGGAFAAKAATSTPAATSTAAASSPPRAHDGGVIAGKIVAIDYVRGIMSLRERDRLVDVYVLPSTNIQGRSNGYYTIGDLKKGESVEIFTSVVGPRTNAQIIRLK